MAIGSIGGISVKITADIDGFKAGLNKASARLSKATTELRSQANEFGKWAIAGTAAAAAVSAAIYKSTSANIRELRIQAQVANTSTQEFQKLAYASRTVGIESDKLADILKDVNDRIGDFGATGAGTMIDFFENIAPKVGVTYENFKKLSGKDALQLYVSSLERANLSQADMTFYMEAIANDSTRLIPLLRDNGHQMTALALEAERLGLALSDVDIAKVENANKELDKAGAIIQSSIQGAVVSIAPLVGAIAEQLNDAAIQAGGFGTVFDKAMSGSIAVAGVFADGLHGIRVVVEGLVVVAASLRAAWVQSMRVMTTGMEQFVNLTIAGINEVIKVANGFGAAIDPIESFTFGAAELFRGMADESSAILSEAISGWHELAMQPLPSETLDQWVERVRQSADEAAKAVNNALGGGGESNGMNAEEMKALDERLEAIRQNLMSEKQLKAEAYLADLEAIKQKRELDLENKAYYDQLEKDLQKQHYDELVAISKDAADKEAKIEADKNRQKLAAASSALGSLSNLMNTESRRMFKIGKAAALAQAVVDGIAAVQGAYKIGNSLGGPLLGAAYATAAGIGQAAQVDQIRDTQFGSTGTGQSFQGGVVANNTAPVQQQPQVTQVDLRVTGNGGILDVINFEIENGGTIINQGG